MHPNVTIFEARPQKLNGRIRFDFSEGAGGCRSKLWVLRPQRAFQPSQNSRIVENGQMFDRNLANACVRIVAASQEQVDALGEPKIGGHPHSRLKHQRSGILKQCSHVCAVDGWPCEFSTATAACRMAVLGWPRTRFGRCIHWLAANPDIASKVATMMRSSFSPKHSNSAGIVRRSPIRPQISIKPDRHSGAR